MGHLFVAIYNFFERQRIWLWLCTIGCFLLAGFFAAKIRLEEDITKVLPQDKKLDKLQQVFQDSKFADKLIVTVSQKDTLQEARPDSLTAYAAALITQSQEQLSPYIKQIQGQADDAMIMEWMQRIQDHLPIFLEEKDYHKIDTLLTPQQLQQTLQYDYNTLISPAGLVLKKMIQADPVGISWIGVKKLQHLQYDDQFELYDSYIMTKDHRHLMLFVTPVHPASATKMNARFLQGLDHIKDSLDQRFPGVAASYFGGAAVSVGNATQLQRDTLLTQGITVVLLVVLIAFFFRKKRAPVLIMLPVIFGGLFSLACIYVIKGHISVMALGAGAVVLGIAVNYSLHVFNHYRHSQDIREVIHDLATPMTLGSFTTVGGFLCLQFVQSPMLRDVGLFAALSLVGAALFSLIFLPHWIVSRRQQQPAIAHDSWLDKIAGLKPERNKYLVGGIFLLTIVFFFTARDVSFESDMMRMNYMTPGLKAAEARLNSINSYTAQSVYVVTEGNSLEEALENGERLLPALGKLQEKGIVKKYAGVQALLLSAKEQQLRIQRWEQYWTPEKKQQLLQALRTYGPASGFSATAFNGFEALLQHNYAVLSPEEMEEMGKSNLGDFIIRKQGRTSLVTLLKVDPAQKQAVYAALESLPHTTVLDKQYAANRLVEVIKEEFNSIAWMTSLLVFFALLLSYGRIELALITFIPMAVSWIWILGIMGLFGIKFNIVNIILSTFIFGLGDDYSIFMMDGLLQEYKTGKKTLSSFKSSIFLSAITTVLGLGVLIFAKHPSLQSIALISIIGIGTVVLISQVMIPFLFHWLITNRVRKGFAPWTAKGLSLSVFSFLYFTIGAFILTFIGWVLIRWNPFSKEKGKVLYHRILSAYTHSVLYIMRNVKKRIINPENEQLATPAVIISNHQSFLDILVSTMLHPKVILLTNQWVWRSPVFGAVVRLADYYPVADGAEGAIEKLRDRVAQGYSIVVYPEGTRSPDPVIKRFHKGAFYIAEQLNLDILPMVIHGTAYTMTKGDFLLKDGTVTVKYLPRITPDDDSWGDNYSMRTKMISRHFKQEYETLRAAVEVPAYFREQLKYNFIYKGPVLEWYMRIKTKLEGNYQLFHELLPKEGNILDIGCGYGFMDYMLSFAAAGRRITGIDYDEEKIATANHCYGKPGQLHFIHGDIAQMPFEKKDAFILSDVLHYLTATEQEELLKLCIERLTDNGVIIVRDGDSDKTKRHEGTRFTELLSTRIIGFNKTRNHTLSFFSASRMRELVQKYGAEATEIDNTRYTSNVIFVIKKPPPKKYAQL
ncbi:trifunctional MMPL family transporter/lysophospholipid acyltransferase/class I SAM-dependent methyltransferase [Chitinophaga nivalis]|uniref:1-acyl-sn-glycerol-3-phosphate acyltransferase n=1 Tax=Chitinophaga nivalis TaxID=2991709 RepID=A0ABT3IFQ0_9BACT|nr:trifunctional MMPL family transporter/lysophospholipid acyltransferase/class I SAM-dependent methyltransferase [Chitinophaga nivalis]MCW3467525.1 1-acyl-sn-glycerol-3-phosphate acyltransferase [Chitinophaga nivalis]MCW3482783.1 1-acyl-sn-glycerol-3-phosphate acyltransferase [Chitinophaga nivalis]